ncbi:MAG: NADPH-dependent reductase [Clostridiales bacterium]|jgi:multimeric flavodoxin WrbA|nr:NADPH-dependent reductase [Clostridiales bacterium]
MKTLILNGSPRKNGHTVALINEMTAVLEGDIKIVNCYTANISPCIDCRYCFTHKGCSIKDEMQDIYDYLVDCDAVVIASPMHFGTLTAKTISVCSRLQSYWSSRHVRKENKDNLKPKYGALIVTTGGSWPNMNLLAEGIADFIFDHTETEQIGSVYAKETDKFPAKENLHAINQTRFLANRLNELCSSRNKD